MLVSPVLFAQESNVFDLIERLNSPYDEQSPVLSPDGTTLYFTIGHHPQNVGGRVDPGDIWYSRLADNQWTSPVHAGFLLNDRSYNCVAGLSADGSKMFIMNHFDPTGRVAKTQGLSVSSNTGQGWSKPQNITIPYFHNKSATSGYVSPDMSVFVFSAESYGTRGAEDIYVCLKNGNEWSAPKNLGSVINTKFQEMSPSLSPDGKTLYFSSNGHQGKGSFDVFASTRLDDTWASWSEPVSANDQLNSDGRELFFRLVPQVGMAIYTSTTNSDGYGDLKIHIPDELMRDQMTPVETELIPTVTQVDTLQPVASRANVLTIQGQIRGAKLGEPVNARLIFSGADEPVTVFAKATGYTVEVPPHHVYTVRIEASGYVSTMEKINVSDIEEGQALKVDFTLQPVEMGTVVNLKNVLFVRASTDMLPESYPELDLVVSFLTENPAVSIELAGHTDNRGVHRDNVRLSQERVDKVREYLISKGIDGDRISGKGYGGAKPVASNETEETRRLNRRVEFVIKKM